VRITPIFRWYDLWIGLFIDRPNHRLYAFPIPCFGFKMDWGQVEKPDREEAPADKPESQPHRMMDFFAGTPKEGQPGQLVSIDKDDRISLCGIMESAHKEKMGFQDGLCVTRILADRPIGVGDTLILHMDDGVLQRVAVTEIRDGCYFSEKDGTFIYEHVHVIPYEAG
jgi:hypothetical protein